MRRVIGVVEIVGVLKRDAVGDAEPPQLPQRVGCCPRRRPPNL
jgi:hypothetical protein